MSLRCLIVDDNAGFADAARDLLEREGMAVVGIASTSAEALVQARELCPDVALMDIDLGDEDGLELARRLASLPGLEHLRMLLISTHDAADFEELVAASPAVGFLSKYALSASAIEAALDGA